MKKYIKNITKLSLLAIFAISINAEYKLGKDYRLVDNPLPVKKDGIVEVTESFWYGCNHCYSFEPAINSWKANQGPDTKLVKMPITWGGIHQLHAALYFTIESLKLDRLYPTTDNLHWEKSTAQDADIVFGIFNPKRHKHYANSTYNGYNLKLFDDNIRLLEIIRSRHGSSNITIALYFNGKTGDVIQLPAGNKTAEIKKLLLKHN